jgi:hypothetical protein
MQLAEPIERVVWSPGSNYAQWALLQCNVFEVFFGGARGGGKSDGMLGDWMVHANRYGLNANGLMLRRTRTELIDIIERSRQVFGPIGWSYNETDKVWRDPRGARLKFNYLERDADAELYQGHSYTRVYIEEAGNFPSPAPVFKLFATLRSGSGTPVGMRLTGNPGGPGHHWIKHRYVDPAPLGNRVLTDPLTGLERIYIPSKVSNNVYIDGEAYRAQLRSAGSPELVRAWLEGDFSVTLGAFFQEWDTARHVIEPFEIPKDWMRFRAMDWGSASPFCVQWWAVATDKFEVPGELGPRILPRGAMVCYREWYGQKPGQPNVGLKLHAGEVGKRIYEREKDDGEISYGVLDPSAFAEDGGPSIAEAMASGSGGKVYFRRADNARVRQKGSMGGWNALRERLVGDDDGRAMIVWFSTAVDSIRTIPLLQHDPDHFEDIYTDSEDHAGDTARYACMSRPWARTIEKAKPENVSGYAQIKPMAQPGDWRTY